MIKGITRNGIVSLSPAYDLLNTTLAMGAGVREEIALTLNGKKRKLKAEDFIDVYGQERLKLSPQTIARILQSFQTNHPGWMQFIEKSFLNSEQKIGYQSILNERMSRLF